MAISLFTLQPSNAQNQILATDEEFKSAVLPIIKKYCIDCHGGDDPEAGVSFEYLSNPGQILENQDLWKRAYKQLNVGNMPPHEEAFRPSLTQHKAIVDWLELKLYHCDCTKVDDVGRETIQRLNRTEYNNTIHDLLGIDINAADDFPSDDVGHGFSSMGDVLSLPSLLLEKYVDASEIIAAAVIRSNPLEKQKKYFSGDQLKTTGGVNQVEGGWWVLYTAGSVYRDHEITYSGQYIIRVEALAEQAGSEVAKMKLSLDFKSLKVYDVEGYRKPAIYEFKTKLNKGKHRFHASFINDFYNPESKDPRDRDRNLAVRSIEIQGPLNAQLPDSHKRIIFTKPSNKKSTTQAAAQIFAKLLPRTFRRPVTTAEAKRYAALVESVVKQGETFERGIQVGIQAMLVSPYFLFRVEQDKKPNDPKAQHHLTDYELASRLSYFLWSSMPDDELFQLAKQNKLHETKILDQQIARMLKHKKADALVDNFASQWLNLANLEEVIPDSKLFPTFNPKLRQDMIQETKLFIRHIFRQDRSMLDFLIADFSFLNERLADHYGVEGIKGQHLRQVSLPPGQRSGVLTHASILTLTSNPDRNSLVRRGDWIVHNILGLQLPDPPANIPSLEDGAKESGAATLREQLAIHRADAMCASCHNTLDPLGFGMENFDAIGRWRTTDQGKPIDAKGTMPGGESFDGPVELANILKKQKHKFAQLITQKMLTYALGRGLEIPDSCTVDEIVADLMKNDLKFTTLVNGIIHSRPFLMRRGEANTLQ